MQALVIPLMTVGNRNVSCPSASVFTADNTANILTRRGGFSRREMSMYFLPVVISDNEYPIQSSTSTLIVRVCACDSRGNMQSCNPEVLPFSDGLTTGALVAILLCVIILLSKSTSCRTNVYVTVDNWTLMLFSGCLVLCSRTEDGNWFGSV